jgi:RND superfamily putative drug exporter
LFERLGKYVVAHPWRVIVLWVLVIAVIVPIAPKLSEVTSADQGSFVPGKYESAKADLVATKHFAAGSGASAMFVVRRADRAKLTATDRARVEQFVRDLKRASVPRVAAVSTSDQQISPNKRAQLVSIGFQGVADERPVQGAIKTLRLKAKASLSGSHLSALLTGEAAIQTDTMDSAESAMRTVSIATIALIIILLGAVFRGPLTALMPVIAIAGIYSLTTALLASVAKLLDFTLADNLTTLLVVVLFGIGTDYVLFLLFRYRERLRAGDDYKTAIAFAISRVGQAITSSALVVVSAFLALLLSSLGSMRNMAPGFLIAISLMLLAALTLIPALLTLLGTHAFWPSKGWKKEPDGKRTRKVGEFIGRHPGRMALIVAVPVIALAAGAMFFTPDYNISNQLPTNTESARGYTALKTAFPAGALNPTQVYVVGPTAKNKAELSRIAKRLGAVKGVAKVMPTQLSKDGKAAVISVELKTSPYDNSALDLVKGPLRRAAHAGEKAGTVLVGGQTSAFADVRSALNRDYSVVFPVAALMIALILGIVLRSLIAPVLLLVAVALGFAATLGASVGVFQGIEGNAGVSFFLPLMVYLFVIAMGTDYNILMMTRLREEAREGNDRRKSAELAVEHAAPTVIAAGTILAGTFASLMLGGIGLLSQMGFTIAIGIAIVSFVMAALLIPSVAAVLGHMIWWPGHSDVSAEQRAEERRQAVVKARTSPAHQPQPLPEK